ncbi:MAG: hypothetical protein ACLPRE_09230, partial [Limisphaerales bacterium]
VDAHGRLQGYFADLDFLSFIDKHVRFAHITQLHATDKAGIKGIGLGLFDFLVVGSARHGKEDKRHSQS